jgi:hypothetical protein
MIIENVLKAVNVINMVVFLAQIIQEEVLLYQN